MRPKELVRCNNSGSSDGTISKDPDPSKRSLAVRDVNHYPTGFGCELPKDVQDKAQLIDEDGLTSCRELGGFSGSHEASHV